MTKKEALDKIKELEQYIIDMESKVGFKDDVVFLLSIDEYERYKSEIPHINTWWWLRSPGDPSKSAAHVLSVGSVNEDGRSVNIENGAVRPAIHYDKIYAKENALGLDNSYFMYHNILWKIIDKRNFIAISVMPIGFTAFNSYNNSNDYATSSIRQKLLDCDYIIN